MKLTIKTLQQSTFVVEIEPTKTVKELKSQIEKDHGKEYPSAAQKLIYSGKILADDSKLSEYNIDEKKFVVLMITRPPPAAKPATEKPNETAKRDGPTNTRAKAEESKLKTNPQSSTPAAAAPNTALTTDATQAPTVTNTTSSNTTAQPATTTSASRPNPVGLGLDNPVADELSMAEPQVAARLASMMTQPNFRQIQDLIQQNPHLLSSTIEALSGSDPEMYNFISENPDVFVSALNHPPLAGSRSQLSARDSTASGQQQRQGDRASQQASGGRNSSSRQQSGPDQILVNVSEHDKEAIERLKELGFSEYLAIQAYMACDKDEQLAANLLFQMDQ